MMIRIERAALVAVMLLPAASLLSCASKAEKTHAPLVCWGDATFTEGEEAALQAFAAGPCTSLSGTLTIRAMNLDVITLPGLTEVGALYIQDNDGLRQLRLPSLTTVDSADDGICFDMDPFCPGGLIVSRNPALDLLDLPALTRSGSVDVTENESLASLELPALQAAESVRITGNLGLATLSLPALEELGTLEISNNDALPACQPLAEVARLRMAGWTGKALVARNDGSSPCSSVAVCQEAVIGSDLDWRRIQESGCGEIAGDLTIQASNLLTIPATPVIERIDGRLRILRNPSLSGAAFQALIAAGGVEVSGNPVLTTAVLPALTQCGSLVVVDNAALHALEVPLFTSGDPVNISDNAVLSTLDLSSFVSGGWDLTFSDNGALTRLSLPALHDSVVLTITGNVALTAVDLPGLTRVGILSIADNPALGVLELPLLGGWSTTIRNNASLAGISLPALTTPGSLNISVCLSGSLHPGRSGLGYEGSVGRAGVLRTEAQ